MDPAETDKIRLDKWLWAARFFKTRQLAAEAVSGGKVHLNGQRTKPSKELAVGDNLRIHKDQYEWEITVTALNRQRRPAKEAALLYEETPQSQAKRQEQIARQKMEKELGLAAPQENRPNKKERRLIQRFKRADS